MPSPGAEVRPARPPWASAIACTIDRPRPLLVASVQLPGLGGGRSRETDPVDHSVGFTEVAALGEQVGPGERPLALAHARDEASAERAADALRNAVTLGDGPGRSDPIVIEVVR